MNTNSSNSERATATESRRVPTHAETEQKARELWEDYGRPAGRDEEIWLEAERLLLLTGGKPIRTPAALEKPVSGVRFAGSSRSGNGAAAEPVAGRRSR